MSTQIVHVQEVTSVNVAGGVAGPGIRSGRSRIFVHVYAAPANLVAVQGSPDDLPANYLNLNHEAVAGVAAAAGLGAGYYEIRQRPEFVRVLIAQDGAAPQVFRWAIVIHPEE